MVQEISFYATRRTHLVYEGAVYILLLLLRANNLRIFIYLSRNYWNRALGPLPTITYFNYYQDFVQLFGMEIYCNKIHTKLLIRGFSHKKFPVKDLRSFKYIWRSADYDTRGAHLGILYIMEETYHLAYSSEKLFLVKMFGREHFVIERMLRISINTETRTSN